MTLHVFPCAVLLLLATGVGGCAAAPTAESVGRVAGAAAGVDEYRIGPADVLQVSVWKNEAVSRTVPVRPDGMISLPLVNEVRAGGLTPMQLRDALKKKFTQYIPNPEVAVVVVEMHSFAVSVLGEVKTAGRYELKSWTTVLDVLARAGGVTEFAARSQIFVLRPDGNAMKRISFNYDKIIATSEPYENFLVQPGDIVVVP